MGERSGVINLLTKAMDFRFVEDSDLTWIMSFLVLRGGGSQKLPLRPLLT